MSKLSTDLSSYDNKWYDPGASLPKRVLWYLVNAAFFLNPLVSSFGLKIFLLRMFGAKIGKGLVIKPRVNIKHPWMLEIGNHVWIGEHVWIDNLARVSLGNHVCLSQGAFLLCGNHNYKKVGFELMVKEIVLEDGVWVGAKAVVSPGVRCQTHSILTVNSVATKDLEAYSIYQGNPATRVKERVIE